jgi:hypothetical protein
LFEMLVLFHLDQDDEEAVKAFRLFVRNISRLTLQTRRFSVAAFSDSIPLSLLLWPPQVKERLYRFNFVRLRLLL